MIRSFWVPPPSRRLRVCLPNLSGWGVFWVQPYPLGGAAAQAPVGLVRAASEAAPGPGQSLNGVKPGTQLFEARAGGQDGLNPLVALQSAPCHDIYLVHTFGF